ncbi:MAG: WecB/TagA/CpsF family glycosyltransferase [Bacilli bacterium]|nr:WecB/TagA/CpsF family glycosyltransferase [Bacilli bacterium]
MRKYFELLYKKSVEDFYKDVENNLKKKKKTFIVTANPETFSFGKKDKEIDKILLDKENVIVPDGVAIVAVAKMHGFKVKERITGIDLANKLLVLCNENGYKLALLGAKQEVLEALENKIKNNYQNIKLVKTKNGYEEGKDKFFEELVKLEPDVCLVALGIPAQEKLIYKHLNKFKKGIFVGVGGSFDVMSGAKKRAPKFFQKTYTEWLYRITTEPKRIGRFFKSNVTFMFKTLILK